MTDLVDAVPPTPTARLEPVVFAHARVAMLTSTSSGIVVDVNTVAAELFGRERYELVQEPIECYVSLVSGLPIDACLRDAATSTEARSFGRCAIRRRPAIGVATGVVTGVADRVVMELVVSSGCQVSGRDLLLVQLAPPPTEPKAG